MTEDLVVIVNGHAGGRDQMPNVGGIRTAAGPRSRVIVTESLDAVAAAAREVADEPPGQIALWGGDGTVTATLTALLAAFDGPLPPVCILPAGTMNANARGIGLKRNPMGCLRRLAAAHRAGDVRHVGRTLVRVNERAGFLFGIGLIPNFLLEYENAAEGGLVAAFRALGVAGWSVFTGVEEDRFYRGMQVRITADGRPFLEGRFTNVSAGGTEYLPLGFKAYHRAAETPGRFQLVVHKHSARSAAFELWPIRRGLGMKHAHQGLFEHVTIEVDPPEPVSIDGEVYEPAPRIELHGVPIRLTVV